MIQLNYQTNNGRWGWAGIKYSNWVNYAFSLGFLANINHYRNGTGELIEVHIEHNEKQCAWGKEGRIHYYGSEFFLASNLPDWNRCKSAGNGSITCRVNSNSYIYSLIEDYDFIVYSYEGYTTADIFPPKNNAFNHVWNRLFVDLQHKQVKNIAEIKTAYEKGWDI